MKTITIKYLKFKILGIKTVQHVFFNCFLKLITEEAFRCPNKSTISLLYTGTTSSDRR